MPIGSGHSDDPFYRYVRPELISVVRTKRGRERTEVLNLQAVATACHRPMISFVAFIELAHAARGKIVAAGKNNSRPIVELGGRFSNSVLESTVERYCDLFVCCPTCGCADTGLKADASAGAKPSASALRNGW